MVNLRRLTDRAKDVVDKRGGKDALKDDMQELRNIAKGKGSLKEKATAAKEALKDPGERGPERAGAGTGAATGKPAARPTEPTTGAAPTGPDPAAADTPEAPRTK